MPDPTDGVSIRINSAANHLHGETAKEVLTEMEDSKAIGKRS